ncbi:6282_t:CDS:2, partial [Scutellospora calospora]
EISSSTSEISSVSNTSKKNVRELKLVIGSHFFSPLDSACLFAYCSRRRKKQINEQDEPLLRHFNTIYTKQAFPIEYFNNDIVKWKNKNIMHTSRTLYSETNWININTRPIFANHILCPNKNCHGIINVSSGHLQFRILNNDSLINNESKISYLCVPPENELYP